MSKQLKAFCNIVKFLESQEHDLYDMMNDMCILGQLRGRRENNGITFILPSKETRTQLKKIVYSDKISDAVDIILAHIVQDFLPGPAMWAAKKSDIPNGAKRKIEVEGVSGGRVVLKGGVELEVDPRFKMFSRRPVDQAVYIVKKGSITPAMATKEATFEHARRREPGSKPATHAAEAASNAKKTGKGYTSFDLTRVAGAIGGGALARAPFDILVSFYHFVEKNDPELMPYLRATYDYTVFTTAIFVAHADVFATARAAFENSNMTAIAKGRAGKAQYCKIVDEIHKEVRGGRVGGGADDEKDRNDVLNALTQAVQQTRDAHKAGVAKMHLKDTDVPFWTSLNISRWLEISNLSEIRYDVRTAQPAQREKIGVAGLREMCSIILDLAKGESALQNVKLGNLGILVTQILTQLSEFQQSPYCSYPVNAQYDRAAEMGKRYLAIFDDSSIQTKLANMSCDELSSLFENVRSITSQREQANS